VASGALRGACRRRSAKRIDVRVTFPSSIDFSLSGTRRSERDGQPQPRNSGFTLIELVATLV